ncbi:MAG TPA: biotin/lipoyl-containing protein [Streptosporangiaceae bacterium]
MGGPRPLSGSHAEVPRQRPHPVSPGEAALMDLTNEDVADILALLDSLPYDELDLQTTRFRLTLRRTPDGWTQSTQVLAADAAGAGAGIGGCGPQPPSIGAGGPQPPIDHGAGGAEEDGEVQGGSGESEVASAAGREFAHGAEGDDEAGGHGEVGAGEAGVGAAGAGGAGGAGAGAGGAGAGGAGAGAGGLVAVRAPLPGTFYRAPRPGAAPFVQVGSRVGADTVVAIVETMKLMNSVAAGADGTVAEICLANGEFAANGATLMRIRADP